MLQSITVLNEFGNGHRLRAHFNMDVFYVAYRLRCSAAIYAVFGYLPWERGHYLKPIEPAISCSR